MITTLFTNSRPMPFNVLAQQLEVEAVQLPTRSEVGAFCWCRSFCAPYQQVFAGNTDLKNDKTSVLFKVISWVDTVAMELWKEGSKVADLNNNTYGTYYDATNFAGQIYFGYLVNWKLVYDSFGTGEYNIKAMINILGQDFNYESILYCLMPYNELAADLTVRLESYQNGKTESSDIDFTKMNWYSQVRLPGYFRNRQPEFITDNYKDTTRQIRQIQDQIIDTWQLELTNLSDDQKDAVVYSDLLANDIIITDYSVDNAEKYKAIAVYPEEIEELKYKTNQPGANLVLKFRSKRENILKRNTYF